MTEVYVVIAEHTELYNDDRFPVAVFMDIEEARKWATLATSKSKKYRYVIDDSKLSPTEEYADFLAQFFG